MKKLITGSVIIVLIIAFCAALIHFWDNMYYMQILDRMDCGVLLSDVKIELINEDRGGMTNDGVSLYKMTIKDKFDINEMDFSEWSELPISDSIVDYYMIDTQEIYCSELVQLSYVNGSGQRLFPLINMSFHDQQGHILDYWREHYAKRGMAVPEGALGTNPAQIARDPAVEILPH